MKTKALALSRNNKLMLVKEPKEHTCEPLIWLSLISFDINLINFP